MNTTVNMENRIIPYQMLLNAMETTHELVDKILPETGIPSLKIGLEEMISVVKKNLKKLEKVYLSSDITLRFKPIILNVLIAFLFVSKESHIFSQLF